MFLRKQDRKIITHGPCGLVWICLGTITIMVLAEDSMSTSSDSTILFIFMDYNLLDYQYIVM